MKKLILTSLVIVSIFLLFFIFTKKESNLKQNSINYNSITIKSSNLEIDKNGVKKENFSTSVLSTNTPKKLAVINKIPEGKEKVEKEAHYVAYLNYRKEQHQVEEKKMRQYLTHQRELKHIREGGVKSELQRERKKHEVQFQHQYTSTMMSQKRERTENFVKQNGEIKKRREQMHSLKDRQILQTKYRGEL